MLAAAIRAYAVGAVFTGLVLYPAFLDSSRDSFPLSNYPMFSYERTREIWVRRIAGLDARGRETVVPPELVATGEPMQVIRMLHNASEEGREAELCGFVAERVAASQRPELAGITEVALLRERYDAVAWFTEGAGPARRQVLARCRVRR